MRDVTSHGHSDVFANDRQRILHEFIFETKQMEDYFTKVGYRAACVLALPTYCLAPLCILPCLRLNSRSYANAQHVAVTKHEILYVQTQYASCCRFACCDKGTIRKTIPIDRIQDVVLMEPAGGCLPKDVLYKIAIETAGGQSFDPKSGRAIPELTLVGLSKHEATRFTETVKGLKRAMTDAQLASVGSPPAPILGTPIDAGNLGGAESIEILRCIKEGIDLINLGTTKNIPATTAAVSETKSPTVVI